MTPTPPPGLADIEAYVMADPAPGVCMIDRASFRALLVYLREIERLVATTEDTADGAV